ncbi:uncharacterized protein [Aegilops tauschii subsp. strangulata]|uniref:Uncharacterized protein n=1 Tax=Aegilops tauschii subsp. strangulata TaxID=200361 RepID=A0A453H8N7_AEGTS|nr:uncharacterized protein LOC109770024 isoform X2 [Aegilops tauschii subsp. strangulata]
MEQLGMSRMSVGKTEALKRSMELSTFMDTNRPIQIMDGLTEYSDSTGSVKMDGFGPFLEAAIREKADISNCFMEQIMSGMSPLTVAVNYLLNKGTNPNNEDNIGFTPIHYAVKEENDGLVRLLLSKGASADISSREGTPLHMAVSLGNLDILKTLLQHNADPNRVCSDLGTPMTAAALFADTKCAAPGKISESVALECMKLLFKAGADLNFSTPDTPLVIAASKGLSKCVKYLLEVGADANISINIGTMTPIEIAADSGRRDLMEILFPYTSPIPSVSNWSVDGIIINAQLRHLKGKHKQIDKDSKVKGKEGAGALKKSRFKEITLDPADAMMYSQRSLRTVMSSEAQASTDCVRLRPNWRNDDQSINLSNSQAAGQESVSGCRISDEKIDGSSTLGCSEQAIVAQQLVDQIVQIFIKVLDYPSVSVQMECNTSIREMVYIELAKRQICLSDLYVKCDGRIISPESTLILSVTDSTYTILPRLRGGAPSDISFRNLSVENRPLYKLIISTGDNLFEVVKFRGNWPIWLNAEYCVLLSEFGRRIYRMLFELLEHYHSMNRCLEAFTVHDILYLPRFKCLEFLNVAHHQSTRELYFQNLRDVRTILVNMLRYNPSKLSPKRVAGFHELNPTISILPHLLAVATNELQNTINKKEGDAGVTEQWRRRFLVDPAGKSSSARYCLISAVDLHCDYLSNNNRGPFNNCFEVLQHDWTASVQKIPPMKKVLTHKIWDIANQNYVIFAFHPRLTRHAWKFGRNWVTHSHAGELLSKCTKTLLCDYTDPAPPEGLDDNQTKMKEILYMQ